MSLLDRLKNLFSRKKEPVKTEVHMQQPTPVHEQPEPAPEPERLEPRPEEIHKEKKCPYCSAPNDTFVGVCWLCKRKI